MNRVRMVAAVVQLQLVTDDGEHLTPLAVQPIPVPAAEWQAFVDHGLTDALARLQDEQNTEPTESDN